MPQDFGVLVGFGVLLGMGVLPGIGVRDGMGVRVGVIVGPGAAFGIRSAGTLPQDTLFGIATRVRDAKSTLEAVALSAAMVYRV